ncbi:tautomerase family protein [Halioxenophilus aromaticivorans]|uniref:4-oxalocrotonate tautomerase n=1 Tax=Halioxenophilus aromaticivorans TaxID=1306992 RepID=A0AAV3TYI5_9ALTE
MPVVHFHLSECSASEQQCRQLLEFASQEYARILEAPMERVRGMITVHRNHEMALQGKTLQPGETGAPFFEAMVLRGRNLALRSELMDIFTQGTAKILGIDASVIRGRIIQVDPEDWCIAGKTAAEIRKAEIEARADASNN